MYKVKQIEQIINKLSNFQSLMLYYVKHNDNMCCFCIFVVFIKNRLVTGSSPFSCASFDNKTLSVFIDLRSITILILMHLTKRTSLERFRFFSFTSLLSIITAEQVFFQMEVSITDRYPYHLTCTFV